MSLIYVNSEAIRAVGYEGDTLGVQFTTSDTIYYHPGVPYAVYLEVLQAPSLGAYYNQYIRGRYR